jgi:small subunit ribosomal protein S7
MAETIKFKIFDMWDISQIEVKEPGLKSVVNLEPKLILKNQGRNMIKSGQAKVNIVERLMNKLAVSGHRNKKHKIEFGRNTGKYTKNMNTIIKALNLVETKTKQNPIQVLVTAIEKAAPRDETTVIEYGGARYPQAVDVSPLRRVNITLNNIVHGASDKAFNKKKTISEALAEEIVLTYEGNGDSVALRKKNESEKQADAAR